MLCNYNNMSAQIDQYTGPFLSGKSVGLVHNTKQTWIFLMKIFYHFLPVMLIIHLNDAVHTIKKIKKNFWKLWIVEQTRKAAKNGIAKGK